MLCAFLLVAYLVDAVGIPTTREQAFMIGAVAFHLVPLAIWVVQRRKLYQVGRRYLWLLAVCCWLLLPLSGTFMVFSLGF
jgi:hypothetical protein